jgi:hypothetical protein
MAEIDMSTHGLLPLLGKRLQGIEACGLDQSHPARRRQHRRHVGERAWQGGSAGTMTLGSTIRDRL